MIALKHANNILKNCFIKFRYLPKIILKVVSIFINFMNGIYMIIGGNLGNRIENIRTAKQWIEKQIGVIKLHSKIYETEAWGKTDQATFLNQVLFVESDLDADAVLHECLSIEKKMGRVRFEKWKERIIDIDILFFNDDIIKKENLIVPHPFIAERKFTLVPLFEIAPDKVHPILKKTISQLLSECKDSLNVYPLSIRE